MLPVRVEHMLSQGQNQNHSCLRMAFICNFDGTITRTVVCDEIMSAFGDPVWNEIGLDYSCGKISYRDMNMHFASLLNMHSDKLKSFLDKRIAIKDGFSRFLEWCANKQVLFVVVSGSWFSYIRHLLGENGAILIDDPADLLSGWQGKIPVISNDIKFQPTSGSWKAVMSPIAGDDSCSPGKKTILDYLKNNGFEQIIFAGDGLSDFSIAKQADLVFSCGQLSDYCGHNAIPHIEFENFDQILDHLSGMISHAISNTNK